MTVHYRSTPNTTTIYLKWQPSAIGFYKLNTDGAARTSTGLKGIGGVFRNNRGDWVLGYMKGLPHTTNIMAKF